MWNEARHSCTIGSIAIAAQFQQVGFFGKYNRCVLDKETDDKNGNHPVDVGKDTDTDAKHEVPEVQRIADMCIGPCRHEIAGGT